MKPDPFRVFVFELRRLSIDLRRAADRFLAATAPERPSRDGPLVQDVVLGVVRTAPPHGLSRAEIIERARADGHAIKLSTATTTLYRLQARGLVECRGKRWRPAAEEARPPKGPGLE
jgi:hypothetical protein